MNFAIAASPPAKKSKKMSEIEKEVTRIREDIEKVRVQKRQRLRDLDFFILDNSIRESTVGQLRSHTIENKKKIYEQVKKCGIIDNRA